MSDKPEQPVPMVNAICLANLVTAHYPERVPEDSLPLPTSVKPDHITLTFDTYNPATRSILRYTFDIKDPDHTVEELPMTPEQMEYLPMAISVLSDMDEARHQREASEKAHAKSRPGTDNSRTLHNEGPPSQEVIGGLRMDEPSVD